MIALQFHSASRSDSSVGFAPLLVEKDKDCPFRHSSLYRRVFVYPSPGSKEWDRNESGVVTGKRTIAGRYPWDDIDERSRQYERGLYDLNSQLVQYTTELLVREIIINSESCLRTNDPENAVLFYVPYLPATEHHNESYFGDYSTSPYGQAVMDALDFKFESWENTFGLTTKYWQRRNGSDHILVYSEPLHGLYHPRNRRGNFHFVKSQRQLATAIAISVELSTTFVETYPYCARKNILMPYPNPDGRWFNSKIDLAVEKDLLESKPFLSATLSAENLLAKNETAHITEWRMRPKRLAQYYNAGAHGTCQHLRQSLAADHSCTESGKVAGRYLNYSFGYRQASFCPCPGGDSPSAKRMFDALHGGCIPVVLSYDFVWPFSQEFDTITAKGPPKHWSDSSVLINPNDFSLRLNSSLYSNARYDNRCNILPSAEDRGLQSIYENFSARQLLLLRQGVARASDTYAYYKRRTDLPDNPLREKVLPDGGLAHALVNALAERANGALWSQCQTELQGSQKVDEMKFKC